MTNNGAFVPQPDTVPKHESPKSGWLWAVITILVAVIVAGWSFGADLLRKLQEAFLR